MARRVPESESLRSGHLRPAWNRRGALLALGFLLWLTLVVTYAWPTPAMSLFRVLGQPETANPIMSHFGRLITRDAGVLLLWLLAATGFGAALLPMFESDGRDDLRLLLRFATAAGLGLGTLSLLTLGLGVAGWLNQTTAIALLATGGLAGAARWLTGGIPEQVRACRAWAARPAGWGWLALVIVPFGALMFVGAMLPPYVLWTPGEPHGYDVVEYHLQVPREWFEAHRIIPLHHNAFSFFPFNVEMHYLLAMHLRGGPWAGMYLAQFMHSAFIALSVFAACGFAGGGRLLAGKPGSGSLPPVLACIAMATTPWLTQLGAIAYDEGGFLLFGTLAIGWAMRALHDPARRLRRFALAGIFAGFACGAKLTALPEVLVAIAFIATVILFARKTAEDDSLIRRVSGIIAFGSAGLLCFAPWLIRTAAWSGNPVFPELPNLLGRGHFSEVQVERWRRAHSPQPAQRSVAARLHALGTDVLWSWQFGYVLVPLGLVSLLLNRRDPDVWFLGAMLFLLMVFWLGFTHLQSRFFILAVPLCALLIAKLPRPGAILVMAQAVIAFVLLNVSFLTPERQRMLGLVLGAEDLSWMTPPAAQQVPADATLVLVGDARAFLYQIPMTRLRYRTVFDADTSGNRGVIEAWAEPASDGNQWLLIDPIELERFYRTYQPFPPIPAEIQANREPYLVKR